MLEQQDQMSASGQESAEKQQSDLDKDIRSVEQGGVLDRKIPTISRLYAMWRVFRRALPMYLSYTFSFEVFVLIVLLNYIKNSEGQNNINAAALGANIMQLTVALGISNLIPIAILISIKSGALVAATPAEIQTINAEISASMKHIVAITAMTAPVALPLVFSQTIFTKIFGQSNCCCTSKSFRNILCTRCDIDSATSGFENILFGLNHQTPAMWMALSTFLLGSGLAYLLCNGIGPFPEWGYPGIAAGFGFDALLLTIMNGFYLGLHPDFKNYHFFRQSL